MTVQLTEEEYNRFVNCKAMAEERANNEIRKQVKERVDKYFAGIVAALKDAQIDMPLLYQGDPWDRPPRHQNEFRRFLKIMQDHHAEAIKIQ